MATEKTSYWDGVARAWRTHQHSLWRKHTDAINIKLFARWLPATQIARLLKTDLFDEAHGEGLLPMLILRSRSVIAIDVSAVTLCTASARNPGLQAIGADVLQLPFASDYFDVIVSNSTLDHFETQADIVKSLQELRRILKSGGQLLITLDNLANPVVGLRNVLPFRILFRLGLVPYYVGASLTPRELRHILQEVGFEVLEVQAVMHCPRIFAVAIARILSKYAGTKTQQIFLGILLSFEGLSVLPTRFLTGNFVAVKAMKKTGSA